VEGPCAVSEPRRVELPVDMEFEEILEGLRRTFDRPRAPHATPARVDNLSERRERLGLASCTDHAADGARVAAPPGTPLR
jgi:hypothetical protein